MKVEAQRNKMYVIFFVFVFHFQCILLNQYWGHFKSTDLGVRHPWGCILTPLIINCVTMSKLLNLSET